MLNYHMTWCVIVNLLFRDLQICTTNHIKNNCKGTHYYTYQIIKPTTDHWLKKLPLRITDSTKERHNPIFHIFKIPMKEVSCTHSETGTKHGHPCFHLDSSAGQQWPPLNHCSLSTSIFNPAVLFIILCQAIICPPAITFSWAKKELLKTAV